MNEKLQDEVFRQHIAFIGETLGPFFLTDPTDERIAPALTAMQNIDIEAAAKDWPFVNDEEARSSLALMHLGLGNGIDDEDLIWEFRRLFIGPAVKPAPPWGSVYTDREQVVFGESTLALRQWLRENGIERKQDENTPEDHIGLMLILLAWLVNNRPELVEDYLRLHMLTWSSHFLQQLDRAAENPFYEGLARITKASLEGIQEELNISVEYPRYYR